MNTTAETRCHFLAGHKKMRSILSAAQMKARDTWTIEQLGVPSAVLMERAALAAADEVCRLLHEKDSQGRPRVLIAAGTGNNGGDGFACARILSLRGIDARLLPVGNPKRRTAETRRQAEICERLHIRTYDNDKLPELAQFDLLVDAIFGIGLCRDITGPCAELIEAMNASGKPIVAIDIPSGITAGTGAVCGCAVRAVSTVTMQAEKPGQLLYPGAVYTGKLITADIGVALTLPENCGSKYQDEADSGPKILSFEPADVRRLLPPRDPSGNKGSFGKVFLAAGSPGMAGAAFLSASAVLRLGAGMVRILTPEENRPVLQQLLPEAVLAVYRDRDEAMQKIEEGLAWCSAAAVGPGLGTGETARRIVERFLADRRELPLVIDADGLNLLAAKGADCAGLLSARAGGVFVTPHIVEMSRLTGLSPVEIKADLIGAARAFADASGAVCILKDARSVVAEPGGPIYINTSGNDGMATAGSGDVLTGILASLLAQGAEKTTAGGLAAYIHGLAGDAAAKSCGKAYMKASDIISGLRAVMEVEHI